MKKIIQTLSSNIRSFRKSKSLSQEELSYLCGLHRTYISSVERGERNISAENIEKIALALDVEPYMLLKKDLNETK